MSVSRGSTKQRDGGLELINKLWEEIHSLSDDLEKSKILVRNGDLEYGKVLYRTSELQRFKDTMVYAVHRLTFLEMVTKGLSYAELHDAQAYAKFVEKKRKIEDLDFDELRALLR